MPPLRFLALDLYPADPASVYSSAAVEAFVQCSPELAVATVRGWLASEGWVTHRVVRHRAAAPTDWEVGTDARSMAERALSGSPQLHNRRVERERWSLAGTSVDASAFDVAQFVREIHDAGALWLQSNEGVEDITSPRGATVLPLWPAKRGPRRWSPDVGVLAPVELASLLDNVLLEVDQQDGLIGICDEDVVHVVHPGLLRRRLLFEPDPIP